MKKSLLLILLLFTVILSPAYAQWKVTGIGRTDSPSCPLLQVLETEQSVLVFGTLVRTEGMSSAYSISPKTEAVVDGKRYRLLNSTNLPITDEADARCVLLCEVGDQVNYVMEFEKFPIQDGFDIIEDPNRHNPGYRNFWGIHVAQMAEGEAIDAQRFLGCPKIIWGHYVDHGENYAYYIRDDVFVQFHIKWYGKDFLLMTEIVNHSDHGVLFDLDQVFVTGNTKADGSGKQSDVEKYSPDKYDHRIAVDRYYEARRNTGGILSDEVSYRIGRARHEADNAWAKIGFDALQTIAIQAQENRVGKYLDEHRNTDLYALRTTSIKAGERAYGFIAVKPKKNKSLRFSMRIDGYDFVSNWKF